MFLLERRSKIIISGVKVDFGVVLPETLGIKTVVRQMLINT